MFSGISYFAMMDNVQFGVLGRSLVSSMTMVFDISVPFRLSMSSSRMPRFSPRVRFSVTSAEISSSTPEMVASPRLALVDDVVTSSLDALICLSW